MWGVNKVNSVVPHLLVLSFQDETLTSARNLQIVNFDICQIKNLKIVF